MTILNAYFFLVAVAKQLLENALETCIVIILQIFLLYTEGKQEICMSCSAPKLVLSVLLCFF